ncbi:hypothetical protein LCGC14_2413860 [marine sediment metagenome]|uniref:Uncharacterized protein n=1 Tax=marine sediment metagenome TaxID=412755 RepID=A0A0F9CDT8_9ZZZZ
MIEKDGKIFIKEKNKFFGNNNTPKISNDLNKLFEQIIYIIRFKEVDSTVALTEIDKLIKEFRGK